jgi:hypothetical protein
MARLRIVPHPDGLYQGPLRLADDVSMDTFEGFDSWLRANNCSERTIEDRCGVLAGFTRTHPSFPDVKPGEITTWLGRPGYSPWTRAAYYGHLRSYFMSALIRCPNGRMGYVVSTMLPYTNGAVRNRAPHNRQGSVNQ